MSRKKSIGMAEVRVTGPGCRFNDRNILPGETATVPTELAREWIETERAVATAEVKDGDR